MESKNHAGVKLFMLCSIHEGVRVAVQKGSVLDGEFASFYGRKSEVVANTWRENDLFLFNTRPNLYFEADFEGISGCSLALS